jgi:hypothetical protein
MTDLSKPSFDIFWFLWRLTQHGVPVVVFDLWSYGAVKAESVRGNVQYLSDH